LTADERTPVSWLLIERGWKVFTTDGLEIGTVHDVVGDSGKDIFDGLTIASGLQRPRYVPAERVGTITQGRVDLELSSTEAERLEDYQEPAPSEKILPVTASRWERFLGWFRR
jgi:PRC-barrel domain